MAENDKTAFVFAGGGSLGSVQVGMLQALAEAGVRADFLVGSSVGAINAVYFAADPTPEGVLALKKIWSEVRRNDIFRFSIVSGLKALLSKGDAFLDAKNFRCFLKNHLPVQTLEQTHLPCHVVATDILDGQEVILSSGPAVDSLLASAAIPAIFPPVKVEDRFLTDGGVANHTPVSTAVSIGAKRLIVLPTGFSCALKAPPEGAITAALHALNLVIARQLAVDVERYESEVELIVVPALCPQNAHPLDFDRTRELIEGSYAATKQWLEREGLKHPGFPDSLRLHRHE